MRQNIRYSATVRSCFVGRPPSRLRNGDRTHRSPVSVPVGGSLAGQWLSLLISPFSGVNEVLYEETIAAHMTLARAATLSAVVEARRRKLPAYSAAATVMIAKLTGRVGAA